MIYLDTSCLVKLLRPEPESPAIFESISLEPRVVISALAQLETAIQLKAAYLAGDYREAQWRA